MSDIEEEDPTSLACICSTIQVSYLNLQCMWGKGRGENLFQFLHAVIGKHE